MAKKRKKNKKTLADKICIGILIVMAALCVVALGYLLHMTYGSKFAINDCVEEVYETEFYRRVYHHRILKVGKESYLTSVKMDKDKKPFNNSNFEWKYRLNRHYKVHPSYCHVEATKDENK